MDTKPAKLFKVGGYLLDPTGRLDANMIRSKIAYGCGYPFVTHYLNKLLRHAFPFLHAIGRG